MFINLTKIKNYIDNKISTHNHNTSYLSKTANDTSSGSITANGFKVTGKTSGNNIGFIKSDGSVATTAYTHPTPTGFSAQSSGLYKITTDAQGHIISVAPVNYKTITITYTDDTPSETVNIVTT